MNVAQIVVNAAIDYLPELELLQMVLGVIVVVLALVWLFCGLLAWEMKRREEERRRLRAWKLRRQLLEKEQEDESLGWL